MQTILHLIGTTLDPLLPPEQIAQVRLPLAEAIALMSKSHNFILQSELEALSQDVHQLRQTVERLLYPVALASLHDFDAAETLDKQLT